MDYAILKTGGQQYRVAPGDLIDVDRLPVETGAEIELDKVVAVSQGGEFTVGRPLVNGAKVIAQVQSQARDKKIRVFKYKRKTRYRRTYGHRQPFTRLQIVEILQDEGTN